MSDPKADVNFFELFDLDPSKPLSADTARQRINDAVAEWNKQSGQPGKGEIARQKRDSWRQWQAKANITDISAITDQELCEKLDPDRIALLQKRKQAEVAKQMQLRAQLNEEVKFAGLKGDILQREIVAWITTYGDVATPADIEQLARPYLVKGRDDEQLLPDKLDRIDTSLRLIGEESLFSLLNLPSSASDKDAVNAAKRLNADALKRKTEEWTTKKNLSGDALAIFAHPSLARQYRDYVRRQQFFRNYLQRVATTCEATHEITSAQAEYLLARAEKDGWNREEAAETLFRAAYERGWRVLPPTVKGSGSSGEELRRQLDAYKQEQHRYEDQHQRDQRQITDAERRAKEAADDRDKLEQQYQDEKKRFEREQANSKLERERLELEIQDAKQRGVRQAKELQRELEALKRRDEASRQRHISEVAPLLASHMARAELVAAQGIVKEFSILPPQWSRDAQRFEHGIAEAKRLLEEAKCAERASRLVDAELLVDQALTMCADLPQAQAFKASLRPEAPTHLEVRVECGCAALTWAPSPSRGVRYVVIRSEGTLPLSARDGFKLATVETCAWRDEGAPPAQRLWYAVFAERGSTRSAHAAISNAAVLVVPDVLDVQAESSDAAVELRWRLPRDASSIRVVRNETHPPRTPDDGHVFTLGETTHFDDTHLADGRRYYYRIYCEYVGPDGDMLRSEGVTATAIPTAAPVTVSELTLSGVPGIINHSVRVDAPPPAQGTLVVYRTRTAPALMAGMKVPDDQHTSLLGADCHTVTGGLDMLLQAGEYFYTPVILIQQMAYIGKPQAYRYCPPVRQLKARDIPGQGVELHWTMPSGCDSAEVRCGAAAPDAATSLVALVPCGATSDVVHVVHDLPRGVYRLHVLVRYQFAEQIVYSSEETLQVAHLAPVRIRYALQTQHRFMGRVRATLVMRADEPVALPGVQVVYGREPITSPSGGRPLAVFAGSPFPATTWTMDIPEFTPEPGARVYVYPDPSPQPADIVFEYAPTMSSK